MAEYINSNGKTYGGTATLVGKHSELEGYLISIPFIGKTPIDKKNRLISFIFTLK